MLKTLNERRSPKQANHLKGVLPAGQRGSLRPADAAAYLGIGLSTLWVWAKRDANFPKPTKLGARTTIFFVADLDAYLESKRGA